MGVPDWTGKEANKHRQDRAMTLIIFTKNHTKWW